MLKLAKRRPGEDKDGQVIPFPLEFLVTDTTPIINLLLGLRQQEEGAELSGEVGGVGHE